MKGEFVVNPGHPRCWREGPSPGHAVPGRADQASLFDRLDWLALIADHLRVPGTMRLLRTPGMLLPLAERGRGRFEGWSCYYNFRFAPIFSPGIETAQRPALLAAAARAAPGWHIALAPLAVEAGGAIGAAFRRAGWQVIATPEPPNLVLDLAGRDFATYWEGRPGKLRSTVKRKGRTGALDLRIHDRFDAQAWAAYRSVYEDSWKGEEGSWPFLEALARQEGAAGTLRLGIASRDGTALAAQLWTVENGEALIHKLAYREAAKPLSAGTLLSHAMFAHAIDRDRVARIDYGIGGDAYKRDWMEREQARVRLDIVRPAHPLGLAWLARHHMLAAVRRAR